MVDSLSKKSIMLQKAAMLDYSDIAKESPEVQLKIYRETLADMEKYLDTGDVRQLSSESLTVIKDDILAMIAGIRDLKTKMPPNSTGMVDDALQALRRARDGIQVALGLFQGEEVPGGLFEKLSSELEKSRGGIERANLLLGAINLSREEPKGEPPAGGADEPPPTMPSETKSAYKIQENALEKHAATDKPIQDIEQDRLGFGIYVQALHDFIVSEYTTTPLTISIDGPWGAGKSSLMYMLKNSLEPQRKPWKRFVLWLKSTLRWGAWFFIFLARFPVLLCGRLLLRMALKFDENSHKYDFRIGKNHTGFRSLIADINSGLSTNPEVLQQKDNQLSPRVRWWAGARADCEPMKPASHPTIWLNAWKFDNEQEVWASLALATLEQIRQKHNIFWMIWFRIRLSFMRLSTLSALGVVFLQFVLPLVLGLTVFFYQAIAQQYGTTVKAFNRITEGYGYYMLWVGAIVSAIVTIRGLFKDPFQIAVDKVFNRPNYQEKVGFLTRFEQDFARIVELASNNGFGWKRSKLIIFVDDLDRCEPPRAADVVEAINLFLDAEGCVFVVGMDSEAVAMSIEVKYKDLFARMKAENVGAVSLGRAFLEKIVQIPFTVPRPTPDQILSMVKHTLGGALENTLVIRSIEQSLEDGKPEELQKQQARHSPATRKPDDSNQKLDAGSAKSTPAEQVDPASFAREKVRKAIDLGTELLSENPRQAKTFVNLFRLSIYIANARGFFEEWRKGEETELVGLERLAMWVVFTIRWQNVIRHLYIEAQNDSLRDFLNSVSKAIPATYKWEKGADIPSGLKKKFTDLRESEKNSAAHWCHLPWEWWLREADFLKCIKLSAELWEQASDHQIPWLSVLLTMTKPISQGERSAASSR